MGKRRRKRGAKGIFRMVLQGILKVSPLLFLGAVGFGIFWGIREDLYADSSFLVQTLEVRPVKALSEEKLQELEKLFLNRNLFQVSLREVARILEQDPQIGEARVTREFPKTLRIEIKKRTPSAQIQLLPTGAYWVAAEDGVVLAKASVRDPSLLLVEAFEAQAYQPERGELLPLAGSREALALTKAFRAHPLARSETIERIRLDHLGNVTLVLANGPELRFGREPMKKFYLVEALPPLLQGPERNRIIYIELQYQDLIVRKK